MRPDRAWQAGDVLDYVAERHHCREGVAIVRDDGCVVDNFWGGCGGDSTHHLTAEEMGTATLRFRYSEYRRLGADRERFREEWLTYAPEDRKTLTSQHHLQVAYFVRVGAEPDLATQLENAREAVLLAEGELWVARQKLDARRGDVVELEAKMGVEPAPRPAPQVPDLMAALEESLAEIRRDRDA